MIIRMRCDEPMARRKHLKPCDHRCAACVAGIEVHEGGEESHVTFDRKSRGCDRKLFIRNQIVSGRIANDSERISVRVPATDSQDTEY